MRHLVNTGPHFSELFLSGVQTDGDNIKSVQVDSGQKTGRLLTSESHEDEVTPIRLSLLLTSVQLYNGQARFIKTMYGSRK